MAVSSARSSGPVLRSLSPSGSLSNARYQASSPARSIGAGSASGVRFSLDRSIAAASPRNHVVKKQGGRSPVPSAVSGGGQKRSCMCSPTNHPGSFRCSLHKNSGQQIQPSAPYQANRLNARRSAMTNSLVRIGTVEGELVKRALAALIRPTSHNQRRRSAFQARPSRLSVMSKAEEDS